VNLSGTATRQCFQPAEGAESEGTQSVDKNIRPIGGSILRVSTEGLTTVVQACLLMISHAEFHDLMTANIS
jgi:hypothetical protein